MEGFFIKGNISAANWFLKRKNMHKKELRFKFLEKFKRVVW